MEKEFNEKIQVLVQQQTAELNECKEQLKAKQLELDNFEGGKNDLRKQVANLQSQLSIEIGEKAQLSIQVDALKQ